MSKVLFIFSLIFLNTFYSYGQQTVGLFQNDSLALNGYTLITNLNSTEVFLIDNCGNVVNSWNAGNFKPGAVVYLLDDGSILKTCKLTSGTFIGGGSGGRLERYNWNDSLVWEYNIDSPTERQHHDVSVLPNGNILILSWDLRTLNQSKALGLDTSHFNNDIWFEKVVEITPIGNDSAAIVWEWFLKDHIIQDRDSTMNNFGDISANRQLVDLNYINNNGLSNDYFHANGLDYNPNLDQILISIRNYDEIWIIDHSTTTAQAATNAGGNSGMGGDILYRWGNPETYQQGNVSDKMLFGQHNPNWIPNGYRDQGKIMIFNNGFNNPNQTSTVEIINPPIRPNGTYIVNQNTPFDPTTPYWDYTLPLFVDFVSGAVRLENGNTFITSGPDGHIYELDTNDLIVWEYISPLGINGSRTSQGSNPGNNTMFRSYRYAENHPAFLNRTLTPNGPLELNPSPSNCIIYHSSTTSVNKLLTNSSNDFIIYPNPNNGTFELKTSGFNNSIINITVRDMNGRIISDETNSNAKNAFYKFFDLTRNAKGMYFITVQDGEKFINEKIIVQ